MRAGAALRYPDDMWLKRSARVSGVGAALLLLCGCGGGGDTDGDVGELLSSLGALFGGPSSTDDTGWDASLPEPPAEVWWVGHDTLRVEASVPGALGMVETDCGDDAGRCWTGEDCLYGDATGTFFLCHPVERGERDLEQVFSVLDLVEGETTLFTRESGLTYIFDDGRDCWVWGHDAGYYAGLGCAKP